MQITARGNLDDSTGGDSYIHIYTLYLIHHYILALRGGKFNPVA